MEVIQGRKTLKQRRAEYVAMCRSFGYTERRAEEEWDKWLTEQGEAE